LNFLRGENDFSWFSEEPCAEQLFHSIKSIIGERIVDVILEMHSYLLKFCFEFLLTLIFSVDLSEEC
jgi:hypothetical protein